MVRIQLENGYLEVKEGTKFPLNFGVGDIRDISKRSGTFSKTITLIGSDNNNQLLNHYYDVNIQAGTFNIDTLTKCTPIQNGVPVVEDCFLQLVSVDKVQNSDGHDEQVEYKALIKDSQADFFTKIDNSKLEDIDVSDLNHRLNSTNIVTSFTHTVTDGYVYPIAVNPSNVYPLTSMRPAIYAKIFWDRIHAVNGFSYEWSDISIDHFDECVIPYNGDTPEVDNSDNYVLASKVGFTPTLQTDITGWTEVEDDNNLFNPTTGVYTPPFYFGAGQSINYTIRLGYDLDLVNATGANAYLVDMLSTGFTQGIEYEAHVRVMVNGVITAPTVIAPIGNTGQWLTTDNPLPNGTTTLVTDIDTIDVPVSNVLPTDSITFQVDIVETATGSIGTSYLNWKDSALTSGTDVTITPTLVVSQMRIGATVSANTLSFGQTLDMNTFIPKNIKQKDFIKWIVFRWNLFVELDNDNPNKLIYKSRDKYYDEGTTKDWTYKLAKDSNQELQFLPDLTAKKIVLKDKLDDDTYNTTYHKALNEVYGQLEFTYNNEYVKGTDEKETIFSPTPMVKTGFNAIVPSYDGSSPKNNIRLLLHNGVADCNGFDIIDYGTTGAIGETSYPVVSHFDDNLNPTFDLNFGVCDYYFYDGLTLTNNNMYNLFWRRTINQINTGKMLIAYFDLVESDIQTLELSDTIRIDNSYWNINRVIDYNANGEELTKVELMSVDTELAPFKTKSIIDQTPNPNEDPLTPIIESFYEKNNVNYSTGDTVIKGIGNVVLPNVKAYVIGDNGVIDEDGYWLNGAKVGDSDTSGETKTYNLIRINFDYTVNPDFDEIIEATGSGITITMPDRRLYEGKKVYIKNYSGGNISLTTATSSIDGDTTITLLDKESLTLASDFNRWIIL